MSAACTSRESRCASASRIVVWWCLAAVVVAAATAVPTRAQQPAQPKQKIEIPADGTELFRALLDRKGIKPVREAEIWQSRYDDLILIVLGSHAPRNQFDPAVSCTTALRGGGAVLIASDSLFPLMSSVTPNVGVIQGSIQNNRIVCLTPGSNLRGMADCPFVVPVVGNDVWRGPEEDSDAAKVFSGLSQVATNQPSNIQVGTWGGHIKFALARFPAGSRWVNFDGQTRPAANVLFAVGGYGPDANNAMDYRFLAMADHSVFINQMLIEPGTQNLELAFRTIEYLQGPQKRSRCLFIENGQVIEEFDGLRKAFASQQSIPVLNFGAMQEKLADLGNAMADKVQKEDMLNRIFRNDRVFRGLLMVLFWVAAVYLSYYLIRRWWVVRTPTDLPPPPTIAGVPSGPPGVFDRRQKELLRRDNVYEPVRDLVREFFESLGIHGDQGPRHPKVAIADIVRKPDSLRQAIRDFWKLAYGPPQELTVSRWRELESYFVRLRDAHAAGKWRFVMADSPVAVTT
ncbi:MAG TPA: hypothetical protein VLM40_23535 [Gemmata sp.]|nr:hypothetical protein [Gemmata sp.]